MTTAASSQQKRHVRQQLNDWERRLVELYKSVEKWAEDDPRLSAPKWSQMRQRKESMLEQAGVPPRDLPTLSFAFGKHGISFTPSVLWIIGANGRVNLAVNDEYHSLVDLGGEGGGQSKWHLVSRDARKNLVPFTKAVFRELVDQAA